MDKELSKYRLKIDEIDSDLINILNERFSIVQKISKLKDGHNIYDKKREEDIIRKALRKNKDMPEALVRQIFERIFCYSRSLQLKKRDKIDLRSEFEKGPLIIAGPCAVESRSQIEKIAKDLSRLGIRYLRGGAFKPRTSPESFQGLGMEGLFYLREAADKYGMKVVTEIMDSEALELGYDLVDVIQIGTRNMFSYGFLKQVGKRTAVDHKPVLLKRGLNSSINEFINAARYIMNEGNPNVILCLRGIRTIEQSEPYFRNTPDMYAILALKEETDLPVIFDPSHATGQARYVNAISKAAINLGADGLIVETHYAPDKAKVDGSQTITIDELKRLLDSIRKD